MTNVLKILQRLVAVSDGSKIPLFDFFSALAEGMSLRDDGIADLAPYFFAFG